MQTLYSSNYPFRLAVDLIWSFESLFMLSPPLRLVPASRGSITVPLWSLSLGSFFSPYVPPFAIGLLRIDGPRRFMTCSTSAPSNLLA